MPRPRVFPILLAYITCKSVEDRFRPDLRPKIGALTLMIQPLSCILPDPDYADRQASLMERLRRAGLRPTRQRVALGRLLFGQTDRHVTAEQLHTEAERAGVQVSLATVYNTLHQFTDQGLLREVVVEAGRSYFDTNIHGHHHFFELETGTLIDIPEHEISIAGLPQAPEGAEIERVDLVVRVRRRTDGTKPATT